MEKKQINLEKEGAIIYISMTKDGYFALEQLIQAGKKVDLVMTLRNDKSDAVSDYIDFSTLAVQYNIPIKLVTNVNKEIDYLKSLKPALIIVNGWSQLLSEKIISLPTYGCVGTHPSLLPKNRGRAPIAWHFINEEKFGGITLFYLDNGCDSGPIIEQMKFTIFSSDNAQTYYEKITHLGTKLILKNYDKIINGTAISKSQNHKKATYLLRRRPKDNLLDFKESTRQIHNKIRAVSGIYPAVYFYYQGNEYKILSSKLEKLPKYSGVLGQIARVTDGELWVLAKDGVIILTDVQDKNGNVIVCTKVFRTGYVINE